MKRNTGLRLIAAILAISGIVSPKNGNAIQAAGPEKKDSIIIQKTINNNNNNKHQVNIYTNTSQKVLFFSASGEKNREYKLLLFRKEGILIKQSKVRNRETTVVIKPEKGNYYYEVLTDDEHVESGTITVI